MRLVDTCPAVLALPVTPVWSSAHLCYCHLCLSKLCAFIMRLVHSPAQLSGNPTSSLQSLTSSRHLLTWQLYQLSLTCRGKLTDGNDVFTARHRTKVNFDVSFSYGVQKHMVMSVCLSFFRGSQGGRGVGGDVKQRSRLHLVPPFRIRWV